MLKPSTDTIAAIATPVGSGGVGIVRVSGNRASAILATVMKVSEEALVDRRLDYGHAHQDEEKLDEVLFVLMRGPRSFTGEDVAEIHGHGGAANMGRLLRAVIAAGARHAEPGEFTRRAFEQGRLDLTRAEAIADIVHASSEQALRVAQHQLRGRLGNRVQEIREAIIGLLAEVEAGIDFPDEELSFEAQEAMKARANDAARHCEELASTFGMGRALQSGIDVALRGPVNAGKSSLFNALLGDERALVASAPGTTRDFVEAQLVWKGVPITLVDTAGERDADNEVESRGIEMGERRASRSDVLLLLVPAGEPAPESLGERELVVRSKVDLLEGELGDEELATSASTGEGLDRLLDAIVAKATGGVRDADDGLVVTSERQRARLVQAGDALRAAAQQIGLSSPPELVAIDLRTALAALAEITGEEVGEEMLDELFSRFCIGK